MLTCSFIRFRSIFNLISSSVLVMADLSPIAANGVAEIVQYNTSTMFVFDVLFQLDHRRNCAVEDQRKYGHAYTVLGVLHF